MRWTGMPYAEMLIESGREPPKGPACCLTHATAAQRGMYMHVCRECGNKRCPHATDCSLECTGSNEPGQPGSLYE